MEFLKKNWPLIASITVLWLIVIVISIYSANINDGKFIYILDDPYIHMSIAKNMATDGNWGVNPDQFSSSSSSPLWTLLLAGLFKLMGVNEIIPLIINILAATSILILAHIFLLGNGLDRRLILLTLLILLWATPLPSLIFTGLEHTLYALIALIFLLKSSCYLARLRYTDSELPPVGSSPSFYGLLILSALLSAVRYEGLLMIFVVCVYLFVLGKLWRAIALGLTSLIPATIMGVIATSHGWYFLPNSVLLKGGFPDFSSFRGVVTFLAQDVIRLFDIHALLILVIMALALYLANRFTGRIKPGYHIQALVIFMFTVWFHLQFADIGWYFRYEAYLITLGILAVMITLPNIRIDFSLNGSAIRKPSSIIALTALAILIISPFFIRGGYSIYFMRTCTHNIYSQQYQMGLFLERYYNNLPVVLNDIGAASFLSRTKVVDIWGLADKDVAASIFKKQYTIESIDSLARARGARLALVYENINRMYNAGGIPPSWQKAGSWTIPNNSACYNETVTFYAIDNTAKTEIQNQLIEYAPKLPPDVNWQIMNNE